MARYFLRFHHSDTGLTPTFTFFKKATDLSPQVAPAIGEVGSGTYYFDYSPTFDVVFEVDGGGGVSPEEVRYIGGTIGPSDVYVDEPVSQVKDDVWDDAAVRGAGTKGAFVAAVGAEGDVVDAPTVIGKIYRTRNILLGGTGYGGTGVDIKTTYDRIGAPALASVSADIANIGVSADTAAIASAVWDEDLTAHVTADSAGAVLTSAGTGGTAYVSFLANGDTVNPVIAQVTSPGHTQVRVTYSEAVLMDGTAHGALNMGNYSIPGLTITSIATLTPSSVMLTTSAQTPNNLYNLTITNVHDLQGNPIS